MTFNDQSWNNWCFGHGRRTIYKLAAATQDLNPIGIVRHEKKAKEVLGDDVQLLSGDIFAMTDSLLSRFDVIVDAFGTNPADADRHLKLAEKLVNLARKNKIRLIFILGTGSLQTGEDEHLFVDDLEKNTGFLQLDQYAVPAVKGAPVPRNNHGCRLGRNFASGNV